MHVIWQGCRAPAVVFEEGAIHQLRLIFQKQNLLCHDYLPGIVRYHILYRVLIELQWIRTIEELL